MGQTIKTMDQVSSDNLSDERFEVGLLASLAALALFLATVGIYGVVNFDVMQRTHEIGVRMAVGATPEKVLTMILREGIYLGLIGVGCGMAGVWIGGRAMKSLLWGIGEIDIATVAVVAVILLAASVMACYLPARSAIRLDPIAALRYE